MSARLARLVLAVAAACALGGAALGFLVGGSVAVAVIGAPPLPGVHYVVRCPLPRPR